MLPLENSGALKGQFTFVVADRHFDLPAARISQDNLPGELGGVSGFRGEQVPRGLSFAPSNHQPEGLAMSRIRNGESEDACLAFTTTSGIPEQTMIPRTLAFANLPRFAQLPLLIQQVVVFRPA